MSRSLIIVDYGAALDVIEKPRDYPSIKSFRIGGMRAYTRTSNKTRRVLDLVLEAPSEI